MLTELALSLLGFTTVMHQEIAPDAVNPMFINMGCFIAGEKSRVIINPQTIAEKSYQKYEVDEVFYCQFVLNPSYIQQFLNIDLIVAGDDGDGHIRIAELKGHPFWVGTLFVPQIVSTATQPHPLITRFLLESTKRV